MESSSQTDNKIYLDNNMELQQLMEALSLQATSADTQQIVPHYNCKSHDASVDG